MKRGVSLRGAASLAAVVLVACGDSTDPGEFDPGALLTDALIAGHATTASLDAIPDTVFDYIRDNYRVYYGHTSHGSQIVTGLNMLADEAASYEVPHFHEVGDDLGHNGDVSWAAATRSFLDAHPEYNVVMWSWCGGVSDNTQAGIQTYLNAMQQLESDYPNVLFVYMTGHLDGSGPSGNLYERNNQIRSFVADNDRVLFDFADIESYDPAGNYHPDDNDGCNWCTNWCASNSCPPCGSCAHSHCFNCYQKGKAFWWMMARVAGWRP